MKTIYLATKNKGKIREFETFFSQFNYHVKSLLDLDNNIEIEETGLTFQENALIKARTLCKYINEPVLADDSGLEVRVLNNEPGVNSARYAGIHGNDELNNQKLLEKLRDYPNRREARFVCVLALVYPNGKEIIVEGDCHGIILNEKRGTNGFGYDPLFFIPELKKTYAELTSSEKMSISHRGKALKELEKVLMNDNNHRRI
ncbi:MAG TPA: XTP/dITP diphosphatase [Haloplasmataceae bacterium]